jgi:hypothetical protein
VETRTAGSASGLGKRVGSNPDTAPQADSTKIFYVTKGSPEVLIGRVVG